MPRCSRCACPVTGGKTCADCTSALRIERRLKRERNADVRVAELATECGSAGAGVRAPDNDHATWERLRPIARAKAFMRIGSLSVMRWSQDEILHQYDIALWQLILRFDASRGVPLEAWVWTMIDRVSVDVWRQGADRPRAENKPFVDSLDRPVNDDRTLGETLVISYEDSYPVVDAHAAMSALALADYKDAQLLYDYFFNERAQAEIARDLGLTESRVSQKIREALRRTRIRLAAMDPELEIDFAATRLLQRSA